MSTLWQQITAESADAVYHYGTRRSIPPSETLRSIRPLLGRAGITRLADVTSLDWIGMPVYQAIQPNSRNLSVSQGKGLTRAQAQVSALMEALESFHGEEIRQPTIRATVAEMRGRLAYDPYTLQLVHLPGGTTAWERAYDRFWCGDGASAALRDDITFEWVAATDLWTGDATWVPKQLCDLDYSIGERFAPSVFLPSSNGLASGNTVVEALIHGLCEVIERDCMWRRGDNRFDSDRLVRHETVTSALARGLIQRFERAGMKTFILDTSGPTGLPCFEATLEHPDAPTGYGGAGCHPSKATALIRALTEAAQSRLTMIAASRDDIDRPSYDKPSPDRRPLPTEARRSFRAAPTLPVMTMGATLREIVSRIRTTTGVAPMAVDLQRPEFDLPVVHVVAPGLHFDKKEM
jgi:ribosomal protein S12 methylthiotransferase accessory factor